MRDIREEMREMKNLRKESPTRIKRGGGKKESKIKMLETLKNSLKVLLKAENTTLESERDGDIRTLLTNPIGICYNPFFVRMLAKSFLGKG